MSDLWGSMEAYERAWCGMPLPEHTKVCARTWRERLLNLDGVDMAHRTNRALRVSGAR